MFPRILSLIALFASLVSAHTILTYPGWRGDNLVTNDTFPYGMQWMYPCESQLLICQQEKPASFCYLAKAPFLSHPLLTSQIC
jgi:hypothetical protein